MSHTPPFADISKALARPGALGPQRVPELISRIEAYLKAHINPVVEDIARADVRLLDHAFLLRHRPVTAEHSLSTSYYGVKALIDLV
jgi:hypothetical protein